MPRITVTDEIYRLIRRVARDEFPEPGRRLPDGQWELPVAADLYELLDVARLPGESFNGVLVRMLHDRMGGSR
jgi:hypothetical protein